MVTEFRMSQAQKRVLDKYAIAYPPDCNKILASRLISEYFNKLPATQKQRAYLKRLGYLGKDIDSVSFARASAEIERLRTADMRKTAREALGF